MNTDQIAAEAERRMWLGDNDKDRDQRRSCIKSAIEKAYREGYCDGGSASRQEDIAKFLPLVKQEIAAHSSPAEVRSSERWDGALTASNKDMDARMAEAASASEPPPQELRMIHRNGDLRWEVNGKEEDFIASVEPSIASKICKAFYDKVYSRAAQASEPPEGFDESLPPKPEPKLYAHMSEPPQSRGEQGADTNKLLEQAQKFLAHSDLCVNAISTRPTSQFCICGLNDLLKAIDAAMSQRPTKP